MKNWILIVCLFALALCVGSVVGADESPEAVPATEPSNLPMSVKVSVFNPSSVFYGRLSWLEDELDIVAPQSWSRVINLADHPSWSPSSNTEFKLYLLDFNGIPVYDTSPLKAEIGFYPENSDQVHKLEARLPEGASLPEKRTREKIAKQQVLVRNRDIGYSFRISYAGKEISLIPPKGLRAISFPTTEGGHRPLQAIALRMNNGKMEIGHKGRVFELNACGLYVDTRVEWTLPDMGDLYKCRSSWDTTLGSEVETKVTDANATKVLNVENHTKEFIRVIGFGRELFSLPPNHRISYPLTLRGMKPDALRLEAFGFPVADPHRTFPLYKVELEMDWTSLTWQIRNPLKVPDQPLALPQQHTPTSMTSND